MTFDLHNAVGAVAFVLMPVLAVTAVGRAALRAAAPPGIRPLRRDMVRLQPGEGFSVPIKLLYSLAPVGLVFQGSRAS